MTRFNSSTCAVAMSLIAVSVLAGCDLDPDNPSTSVPPVRPSEFMKFLEGGNYSRAPVPSGLLETGTLVYLETNAAGQTVPVVVGSLEACGLPAADIVLPRRPLPAFSGSVDDAFGMTVLAILGGGPGVKAKVGSDKTAALRINSAYEEAVDRLKVEYMLTGAEHVETVAAHCRSALNAKRVAVVVSTIGIDSGEFIFKDFRGAEVGLTGAELTEIAQIDGRLSAKTDGKGKMTFSEPISVAFKASYLAEGKLGSGDGAGNATDDLVAAISKD